MCNLCYILITAVSYKFLYGETNTALLDLRIIAKKIS